MKLSQRKFMKEMEILKELMVDNFDADGETMTEMAACLVKEMPKGIVEKMNFLSALYDRAQNGEKLEPADLKQAGYWINAAYPYLSQGLERRRSNWLSRIVWLIVVAIACAVAWKFLH